MGNGEWEMGNGRARPKASQLPFQGRQEYNRNMREAHPEAHASCPMPHAFLFLFAENRPRMI